jgi:hypothetical protein
VLLDQIGRGSGIGMGRDKQPLRRSLVRLAAALADRRRVAGNRDHSGRGLGCLVKGTAGGPTDDVD